MESPLRTKETAPPNPFHTAGSLPTLPTTVYLVPRCSANREGQISPKLLQITLCGLADLKLPWRGGRGGGCSGACGERPRRRRLQHHGQSGARPLPARCLPPACPLSPANDFSPPCHDFSPGSQAMLDARLNAGQEAVVYAPPRQQDAQRLSRKRLNKRPPLNPVNRGTPAEVRQTARDLGPSCGRYLDAQMRQGQQWLKKGFWQRWVIPAGYQTVQLNQTK